MDTNTIQSLHLTHPNGFLAHANTIGWATTGLTSMTVQYLAALATGLEAIQEDLNALADLMGRISPDEGAVDRARLSVQLNPRLQYMLRAAAAVPGLDAAIESELVRLANATVSPDYHFAMRPDVRAALLKARNDTLQVGEWRAKMERLIPQKASEVEQQILAARQYAANAEEQLAHLDDDIIEADIHGMQERRSRVITIRRMIKEIVTDGVIFSVARPHRMLHLELLDFNMPDRPTEQQLTLIRGIRDALTGMPPDTTVRQVVLHHRVMAALFALVHDKVLTPEAPPTAQALGSIASNMFNFLHPLMYPYTPIEVAETKRQHIEILCREAFELRLRLVAETRAGVMFGLAGPADGEYFIPQADRVRVAAFEGLLAPPADAGASARIAYTEFGGLVRLTTGRGSGQGSWAAQVRAVWETRPIVVLRDDE